MRLQRYDIFLDCANKIGKNMQKCEKKFAYMQKKQYFCGVLCAKIDLNNEYS